MKSAIGTAVLALALAATAKAQQSPVWAYLGCPSSDPGDAAVRLRVPGSAARFSRAEIKDRTHTRDWFPDEHAPMPPIVAASRSPVQPACGYCHLAEGAGRPENGKITGLDPAYIVAQATAIRRGERHIAQSDYLPLALMVDSLSGLSEADLQSAAEYYARLPTRSFERVVETGKVPAFRVGCFTYEKTSGPEVPIGPRIIEVPDDQARFEARDPHVTYTAYVPMGSIGRGRALARNGGGRAEPCIVCHGDDFKGGKGVAGPPLAGRFAGYLFRQLHAFKTGARAAPSAGPMRLVVANLSVSDFIDLAAYAASLPP